MFFSGDPSNRKRVDLGGRSSKERDRKKLLEEAKLERSRRSWMRQQNSAALIIQKCFRGRKVVKAERGNVREQFYTTYGKHCERVDRQCFGPDSDFLRDLLYFLSPQNVSDFSTLVEACRLLSQFAKDSGDVLNLFGGPDYSSKHALVNYRVKKLVYACIQAVHHNRYQLKDQLLSTSLDSGTSTIILLKAAALLIDPKLPWSCKIVSYLMQQNIYRIFREIVITGKESLNCEGCVGKVSLMERVLALVIAHTGQGHCVCQDIDLQWSFASQILTIPFFWQIFPYLKEIYVSRGLCQHYLNKMATCTKSYEKVLPIDISAEFPAYACLLGNLLEAVGVALTRPACSYDMAIDFATVATLLLEVLPPIQTSNTGSREENSVLGDDDMITDDEPAVAPLSKELEKQISNAIDPRFLLQLTNVLFGGSSLDADSCKDKCNDNEAAAVAAACSFLHVTFTILPLERIMTVLAYRTELVSVLWNFMKQCHEKQNWSSLSAVSQYLPSDAFGWLLPLAVFCPVYKHMLMIVDNEEFYEQEKPLSLNDIRLLIVILRQALWQILWLNPVAPMKFTTNTLFLKKHRVEFVQYRVSVVASELLSQLQDWNNRRQFAHPSDFHADGVNDHFISQAMIENTRAYDILKQAPFLVPFTSRVKLFTSQLAAIKERPGSHSLFNRSSFKIRRDHILEDAFNQLSTLPEEDLRGVIRVTFVNEFGVEEAGIDGGGIFKDFMENITRAAFDMQYGLFKETIDHLLYPNPGSGMIHEQHLQFFHFLGIILGKAMFEGILVDIPFATFFLSKLKQKHNYLNDLPSLDPELYRHLIFLKRYEGDLSELELYFVIVNNEFGEQTAEELIPGGKNIRVVNDNVITFIHLVANHRLNTQIRQQSSHFLRGFQQLIQKDWIDMFNEHELQLLISGSVDGIDVDDLRSNTNYAGGYHHEHYVIDMFWEILKNFSLENQRKFLKFVTGCSRGPLLGFKYLEPLFCIQRAAGSASEEALDRLPTSATCMNLLKLPPYRSKEHMEQKLLYSINAEAGFDLS
ncbi:E3 ubiquitin-protein ligase UPL6 isoform X1 [Cynara cardunculus var. scolymus]|uniref:E3 ubiquitin-protein ligase UPL6 isoform X1 n=2 Tax=Cynara cardunculus var. scolymus TaxID=59895 RepID=UPI000D626067|nr:E3 ubiquitin-protein ligase UPL6 isoform X1 [Cynara cardunculus var. scolymus]XP_024984984.1 E3 ubiquitin-protein ligase UPL6 isoform X1 [Cynara cardunculus var. scolymus]XP_024984985.1 E3 ubiquitin-protein ligase UPL6 isoform X1 [Cynara cardunculus var. scolymus]